MKLKSATDPESALRDINPSLMPAVLGLPTARWRRSHEEGRREDKTLAWYRGRHAGLYDAYLMLKADHPRVAEAFRKACGFNARGEYGGS